MGVAKSVEKSKIDNIKAKRTNWLTNVTSLSRKKYLNEDEQIHKINFKKLHKYNKPLQTFCGDQLV